MVWKIALSLLPITQTTVHLPRRAGTRLFVGNEGATLVVCHFAGCQLQTSLFIESLPDIARSTNALEHGGLRRVTKEENNRSRVTVYPSMLRAPD